VPILMLPRSTTTLMPGDLALHDVADRDEEVA
jgi:hypothetical protein